MIFDKIKSFFKKKQQPEIPPMPTWDEIVGMMYDKGLDAFKDEVVRTIYSKDKTMRYVVLKDEKGFFTYQLEAIYQYDEDEWMYIFSDDSSLPAMWEESADWQNNSFFVSEEDMLRELESEVYYKRFFV